MNITSKSRYALKIMIDLAEHPPEVVVHRSAIAERQAIPLDYMDHVLSRLRDARLVASTRGRGGGYRLERRPQEISMLAVFQAVEDAWHPVACLTEEAACTMAAVCNTRDTWSVISDAISDSLSGILLSDLLARRRLAVDARPSESEGPDGPVPAQECRAPKRRAGGCHAL